MNALEVDPTSGWLKNVRRVASPNCDDRPRGCDIDLIVVHGISLPPGQFGGPHVEQLFTNALEIGAHPYFSRLSGARVSAHVLIRRDGEIIQFVSFRQRAWHAGDSCFGNRHACNDFSIGIEIEGTDDVAYEPIQYRQSARLIDCLMRRWPQISLDRVVGHCDIAPGRKTDPGPSFEWDCLRDLVCESGRERHSDSARIA